MTPYILKFGTKAFRITGAEWNEGRQMALVHFEDDNGIQYHVECLGMSKQEQRQAVTDAVIDAYKKSKAQRQTNDMLKQLAIACGNHPYEDG